MEKVYLFGNVDKLIRTDQDFWKYLQAYDHVALLGTRVRGIR